MTTVKCTAQFSDGKFSTVEHNYVTGENIGEYFISKEWWGNIWQILYINNKHNTAYIINIALEAPERIKCDHTKPTA